MSEQMTHTLRGPDIYNPRWMKVNPDIRYVRVRDMVFQYRDFDTEDARDEFMYENDGWEPVNQD